MKLSTHFTLEEFTHSQEGARRGLDNTPPAPIVNVLTRTAQCLEAVRVLLGSPVLISSGYRSPEVNKAVGGAYASQHLLGEAVDFICPGFGSPRDVARAIIAAKLPFDQLIMEGTWVHISFGSRMRRQALTAHFGPDGTTYTAGVL